MSDSLKIGSAKMLGDELRDIRVSARAPVEQVETDLRIKAKYIIAMEEGDINALPARVYTEGFVRNYAIYLGLDPVDAVRRFFAEQGIADTSNERKAPKSATRAVSIDPLSGVAVQHSKGKGIASAGRGIAALWPLVLVGGLGFGLYAGYGAARDAGLIPPELGGNPRPTTQQVAVVSQPTQVVENPAVTAPNPETAPNQAGVSEPEKTVLVGAEAAGGTRPDFLSYARADATPYWQAPPPKVEPVDGPVSEIDPEADIAASRTGRWTEAATDEETTSGEDASRIAAEAREALIATLSLDDPNQHNSESSEEITTEALPLLPSDVPGIGPIELSELTEYQVAAPAQPTPAPRRFALHANADAWVKIQDSTGVTVYTGILSAGESYNIPDHAGLTLRTGNAGGLEVEVEGQRFGPLGNSGAIMNGVPLNPGAIRASFTLARQATLSQ